MAHLGPYQTMADAEKAAMEVDDYAYIVNDFGGFILTFKRLPIYAPSDAYTPFYYHKGVKKPFTEAQKIADQNSTPTMS
jgi:hypothetical protein